MKRYLSILTISLLAGCATPYQEQTATQGAVIGAAAGAVIGAQSDQVVEGAIIGGVLGGLAGAILADDRDDRIQASAPRYHRSACGRGDIYFERARNERALERRINLMRQGIAYCPNNPAAHNDLGVALMLWGDRDRARMHFEQALRYDPHYDPARHNIERMGRYHAPAHYQAPAHREQYQPRYEPSQPQYNRREESRPGYPAQRTYDNQRPRMEQERPRYQQPNREAQRPSEEMRNRNMNTPRNNRDHEDEYNTQRRDRQERNNRRDD
ncbi:YMGG-like glycine zipper-containing protein [Mariprofundus erugo]|uniref:YMGG-like glycine zipper-containing protein n=1 Tax=Mariprofundus erugo TaxID=2528639 RepID=UPI001EE99034|nr:glycine zipper domain-containing protein [Mariprofundus erugo]